MIFKDTAKSRVLSTDSPRSMAALEFDEKCSICERDIPDGASILRKAETGNVICLLCLVDIAEVK